MYIAIPEMDSTTYTPEIIIATIIHEFTHLKNYSHIYNQMNEYSLRDVSVEGVLVEEGMAHLSETLLGYGDTGGNTAFVFEYLNKSSKISLLDNEIISVDSIERRGGMLLFLSWLFWESGGIKYIDNKIIDTGGIKWIKSYHNSLKRGWDRIEQTTGLSREDLFEQYIIDLLDVQHWDCYKHLVTGESIKTNPHRGDFKYFNTTFNLNGIESLTTNKIDIYPYTFFKINTKSNYIDFITDSDLEGIKIVF